MAEVTSCLPEVRNRSVPCLAPVQAVREGLVPMALAFSVEISAVAGVLADVVVAVAASSWYETARSPGQRSWWQQCMGIDTVRAIPADRRSTARTITIGSNGSHKSDDLSPGQRPLCTSHRMVAAATFHFGPALGLPGEPLRVTSDLHNDSITIAIE